MLPICNDSIHYEKYCNDKYDYCVEYPSLLMAEGESDSGDGQVFLSHENSNSLTIYRDFRDLAEQNFSLQSAMQTDIASKSINNEKRIVTYKKLGEKFYVISGYIGDKIFYQKSVYSNERFVTAILEYEKQDREIYNDVCQKLFNSLK